MDDNAYSLQDKLKRVSDAIDAFDNSKGKAEHLREEMRELLTTLSRKPEDVDSEIK